MNLRDRVLAAIEAEQKGPGATDVSWTRANLVTDLLAEAWRQVERHEVLRVITQSFLKPEEQQLTESCTCGLSLPCPTVRAWAKVFGVEE